MPKMHIVRTTITIDDDLAAQIDALRRREGLTFKAAIDTLLRAGLREGSQPSKPRRYRTRTRKLGLRAGIDRTKLNQLADELESDDDLRGVGGRP